MITGLEIGVTSQAQKIEPGNATFATWGEADGANRRG